jgi:hypothetical protein
MTDLTNLRFKFITASNAMRMNLDFVGEIWHHEPEDVPAYQQDD